jgi:hypothetical protein
MQRALLKPFSILVPPFLIQKPIQQQRHERIPDPQQMNNTVATLLSFHTLSRKYLFIIYSRTNLIFFSFLFLFILDAYFCGRSCGTVTVRSTWKGRFGTTYCDMAADGATTTPNWCNTTPYTNADGTAGGEIIFVYTTCDGTDQNKPLAWCFQDPAYTAQGVSTDPNVWRYKMDASLAGDDGQPVSPWQPNSVELLRCQKDPVNYVPLDPGWYANS